MATDSRSLALVFWESLFGKYNDNDLTMKSALNSILGRITMKTVVELGEDLGPTRVCRWKG